MALLVLTNCAVFSWAHHNARFSKKLPHTSRWVREVSEWERFCFQEFYFLGSQSLKIWPVSQWISRLQICDFIFSCRNLQTARKGKWEPRWPSLVTMSLPCHAQRHSVSSRDQRSSVRCVKAKLKSVPCSPRQTHHTSPSDPLLGAQLPVC